MKKLCSAPAVVFLVLLVLSVWLPIFNVAVAETNQAGAKIQAADNAVNQAFSAVLDAEKSGANVAGLVDRLSGAASLLGEAQVAFRTNDLNSSAVKADSAASIAQDVKALAQSAKSAALVSNQNYFLITLGFSVGGSVALVLALFFVWRKVKKNYVKNVIDAQPEVTQNET